MVLFFNFRLTESQTLSGNWFFLVILLYRIKVLIPMLGFDNDNNTNCDNNGYNGKGC